MMTVIIVQFAQEQRTGSEATGFVIVVLELVGGRFSSPFSVTVTPSEQSPVSAKGAANVYDSGITNCKGGPGQVHACLYPSGMILLCCYKVSKPVTS